MLLWGQLWLRVFVSTYAEVFLLENRPVIIVLDDPLLIQKLMNHLVEERVSVGVSSSVQVVADKDSWRIRVMSPIPAASGDAYWHRFKNPAKVHVIKLIPPSP